MQRFGPKLKELGMGGLRGGDPLHRPPIRPGPPVPVSEQDLASLEQEIGSVLPSDYRAYLLEVGGAAFYDVGVRPIQTRPPDHDRFVLEILFGLREEKSHDDLLAKYRSYRNDIPEQMINIGENLNGDQFCLVFEGDNRGSIYFWDHGDPKGLYLTANSFQEFIERLVRLPDQ